MMLLKGPLAQAGGLFFWYGTAQTIVFAHQVDCDAEKVSLLPHSGHPPYPARAWRGFLLPDGGCAVKAGGLSLTSALPQAVGLTMMLTKRGR
jgi:hypothetical protein